MGGGYGATAPAIIQPGEKLWRLLEYGWYQVEADGVQRVQQAAFLNKISLVRSAYISTTLVDSVSGGRFQKYGIAVLDAGEIINRNIVDLRVCPVEAFWPPKVHVEVFRTAANQGSARLRINHREVQDLTDLANRNSVIRPPSP
jgi:hypothetical protein